MPRSQRKKRMDKELLKEKLTAKLSKENVLTDCPMAKHTSFRCGGNAAVFAVADSVEELLYALSVLRAFDAPYVVLGNGSNTLFSDKGYDGAVIKLGRDFSEIIIEDNKMTAGAAVMLPYISKLAAAKGLSGLEFACGIPGSIGGAVFMDAGAYGGSMDQVIESVVAATADGELYEYDRDELELSYRHSRFMKSGEIILFVKLAFVPADPAEISAKMEELNAQRKAKQPLSFPSAGSFFKRPEGYYAGALIEQSGLKGCTVGGAQVSELHAGFIINKGGASADDVLALCRHVQDTVEEKFGVRLEPEVRIIGE